MFNGLKSTKYTTTTSSGISLHALKLKIRTGWERSLWVAGAIMMTTGLMTTGGAIAGEAEMTKLIAKKAAIVTIMHRKAKKALVNSAQDKVFGAYFHAHDDQVKQELKGKIEKVTLAVQSNFHVEEMCLINPDGMELTRIVGNKIAPDEDLSSEEASAIFFEPGFASKPRKVYVSPPYMSPDAFKWVLAYTTPVVVDGDKKSILHYEHGLDIFQAALNKGLSGSDQYVLAVSEDGFVISDSRQSLGIAQKGEKDLLGDYFVKLDDDLKKVIDGDKYKGVATIGTGGGQYAVAYAKIEAGWTLLSVEKL